MRRNFKLILIFLIILTFLSFGSLTYGKTDTLTLWISWEGKDRYEEIVNEFRSLTGISIDVVSVPKIYQKIKTVARGGGKLPDMAILRNAYIGNLADEGIIKPLPKGIEDKLSEKGKMAFSYRDKLYGLPFYFDAQVVYYNPKLLKEVGLSDPPTSWTLNDLKRYGKALKNIKGVTPLGWGAYSPYFFGGFEYSFKKDCIKCQRERFFTEATEKAILFYKELIKDGIGVSMDRNAFLAGFKGGKIGFIIFGTFILPNFIEEGVDFKVIPLPINPETGKRVASYLDYKGISLFKTEKKGDNVYKFLTYLTDPDVQYRFCSPLYKFPDAKSALEKIFSENPYLSPLRETVETGIIAPKESIYVYYDKALSNVLKLVLEKNIPINKAFAAGRRYMKGKEK